MARGTTNTKQTVPVKKNTGDTVVKIDRTAVTFKHRTIFPDKNGNVKVTPAELEQLKKMNLV